eukprot:4087130-Amphidinium_carterae.1
MGGPSDIAADACSRCCLAKGSMLAVEVMASTRPDFHNVWKHSWGRRTLIVFSSTARDLVFFTGTTHS